MISRGLSPALAFVLLVAPAALAAQSPKDTNLTRDAAKFIGLAMVRQDEAERREMYEQALAAIAQARAEDANNPKVWYIIGQAQAGLGHYLAADSAFDRALALYAGYDEEIEAERMSAWMAGFEEGVAAMEQEQMDVALAHFEGAHAVYPMRPEALLNASNIYLNREEMERAEAVLDSVVRIVEGPEFQKLEPQEQETWTGFGEMARFSVAEIRGVMGVRQYQEKDFGNALASFRKAAELNPYSRDYLFNIVQSLYAQAAAVEEQIGEAARAEQPTAELEAQAKPIYEQLLPAIAAAAELDPASGVLTMIEMRAHQRLGQLTGDQATGQQHAQAAMRKYEERGLDVEELVVIPEEGAIRVQGQVQNRSAAAGGTVTVVFTVIDRDGEAAGEKAIAVTLPAAGEAATFDEAIPVDGEVELAGWKYRIEK